MLDRNFKCLRPSFLKFWFSPQPCPNPIQLWPKHNSVYPIKAPLLHPSTYIYRRLMKNTGGLTCSFN
ncbi:hypothetical protein XELAEV_18003525mg [Xenopus laevis]|uniref:Uncharacterized protein n=1 Tax=Xenopus laevis TaxID=8355 RepID=A0A974GYY1_XENLA|nr:hypothetical protein XELAEV_18003525mg [Xenopus laevis]